MKTVLLILLLGASWRCRADQLEWNSLADCRRAAEKISSNSLVVSYCSLCDPQNIEVWMVRKSFIEARDRNLFQVVLFGRRLYRTKQPVEAKHAANPKTFAKVRAGGEKDSGWFSEPIDFAYIYVPDSEGVYHCLGKNLDLPCEVRTATIRLPEGTQTNALKVLAKGGELLLEKND